MWSRSSDLMLEAYYMPVGVLLLLYFYPPLKYYSKLPFISSPSGSFKYYTTVHEITKVYN